MHWIVLLASAVLEAVWASALSLSQGLSRPLESTIFFVACVASMIGLAWAVKRIPIGTAYAIWVGIGAALTVAYSMLSGTETVSAWKLICIGGIILAVIGLKLAPEPGARVTPAVTDSAGAESRAAGGE